MAIRFVIRLSLLTSLTETWFVNFRRFVIPILFFMSS